MAFKRYDENGIITVESVQELLKSIDGPLLTPEEIRMIVLEQNK
jgi:hypothetical protein